MPGGRPPIPVGTTGKIVVKQMKGGTWRARTLYRDFNGERVEISRFGPTRNKAEAKLKVALRDWTNNTGGDLTADARVEKLAELWLADIDASDLATNTKQVYRTAVNAYVLPGLGQLRLREASVQSVDRALQLVKADAGPGSARTTRSVLSGMFKMATRYGAVPANPVREVQSISGDRKAAVRALSVAEVEDLTDKLRASQRAVDLDLPDLVDFMLGTGMRIGETCAMREDVLSADDVTAEVNATMVRIKGTGLHVQERPKTAAGWRVLALPDYVRTMLDGRRETLRLTPPGGVIFGSPGGKWRDPSNTAGDLREVLDAAGYDWVHSHTFRKTVATRMDEAGCSPREIADQLGHSQPSMTLNVYMGRNVVSAAAARVLDR